MVAVLDRIDADIAAINRRLTQLGHPPGTTWAFKVPPQRGYTFVGPGLVCVASDGIIVLVPDPSADPSKVIGAGHMFGGRIGHKSWDACMLCYTKTYDPAINAHCPKGGPPWNEKDEVIYVRE